MNDKELATIIHKHFPNFLYKIADVGGYLGGLNYELRQIGYTKVITYDPCYDVDKIPPNIEHAKKYFNDSIAEDFDLLVGNHVCSALPMIQSEVIRRKIPFIVTRCCYSPSPMDNFKVTIDGKTDLMIGFPGE